MIKKLLLTSLSLMSLSTYALSPEHEACFVQASDRYSIDAKILKAIAKTESDFVEKIISKPNANGSYDIGMMQINSSWLPTLAKFGINQQALLNACTNIHVGAWVLANNFSTYGKTWQAIGAYNSPSYRYQLIYARKVYYNYALLERNSAQ
jgi:soluble lytic murein transglycosylase-like protein